MTKKHIEELTYKIIGACIEVHKEIGAGLLESVYHKCLMQELHLQGLAFQSELVVPVSYKGINVQADLRCDLFIENKIVLELKAVPMVLPIHEAQLFTYMKLLKAPKGILVNFNCTNIFKEGQRTYVNQFFKNLPDI